MHESNGHGAVRPNVSVGSKPTLAMIPAPVEKGPEVDDRSAPRNRLAWTAKASLEIVIQKPKRFAPSISLGGLIAFGSTAKSLVE